MTIQYSLIFISTFVVTLIGTLAYAVRIVGVRTGRIAITFSLFNILILVSRTASNIQVPLITKYIHDLDTYYLVLWTVVLAAALGSIAIPTFQRWFTEAVNHFSENRSMSKVLLHGFSKTGIRQFAQSVAVPSSGHIKGFSLKGLPHKVLILNTFAVGILTVGVLAPIYAAKLAPDVGTTCTNLSGLINGVASILLYVFVDPFLSLRTDDVVAGKMGEGEFRRLVVSMVTTKFLGSLLAIPLLVPASHIIVAVARWL
jgi:NADH:ubiquinone oxidoreductase subunit K